MQSQQITFKPVAQEMVIRSLVREQLMHGNKSNLDLLTEGMAADLAQDAIQFAVGAAAEYGIGGAIAVGTVGVGTPAAQAIETAVDVAFTAKDVMATVESVAAAAKNAGEFAEMLSNAINGFGGDFGGYYEKLKESVQITVGKMSEGGKEKVEEVAEKFKKVIEDIVSELIGAVESGIKVVIPDATIGLAAAKAVGQAIKSLSENAYDVLTGAIESVDMLNNAITNPDETVKYFEDILKQIAEKLQEVGEYFNDMSWPKAMLTVGPAGGAILKKLGPKGMDKLAGMLEKSIPDISKVIEIVLKKVVPALFACLGIYQIIMKDEYKTEDMKKKESKEEPAAIDVEKKKSIMSGVEKVYLNQLISETINENQDLIHANTGIPQRIYKEEYVRKVLGIDLPLNESYPYSPAIQERILEEQLQLEGFFSDFKKLGGDAKNSALALRYIMEDPSRISSYVDLIKNDLKESYEALKEFLESVVSSLKEVVEAYASPKIEKVLEWGNNLLEKIKSLVEAASGASGWKGAMLISGALVGIGYLWSMFKDSAGTIIDGLGKVTKMVASKIKESYIAASSSLIKLFDAPPESVLLEQSLPDNIKTKIDEVIGELTSKIKEVGPKVVAGLAVNALSGALTGGVGTAFKALQSVFGGAKVVFKFLGGPLEKFVSKIKNPDQETKEAEAGEDDPTEKSGKDKKEESIRRSGSVLSMSEIQLRLVVREALIKA